MPYKIRVEDGVTTTNVDGRAVLFSKKTGDFFGLNDTALHFFTRLLSETSDTVAVETSERFQVPTDIVTRDLNELVDGLVQKKLVAKVVTNELGGAK